MDDNIGKIGGSNMMRLVVDQEARDDTDDTPVNPNSPSDSTRPVIRRSVADLRSDLQPMEAPSPSPSLEEAVLEPADIDGPVLDAADDESAESNETAVDLGLLEALLFSTHHPLTAPRLAELMELPRQSPLRKGIKALNAGYEESRRSFRIEQVAGGYQMLTMPEYGETLKRLHQKEIDSKLTKAAVETLAIIAYKQPILRADVEAIRGVMCGETIRSLMEKHLVRIGGRAELPGRPILYGTTKRFLELFGLNTLKDLPQAEELQPPKQG